MQPVLVWLHSFFVLHQKKKKQSALSEATIPSKYLTSTIDMEGTRNCNILSWIKSRMLMGQSSVGKKSTFCTILHDRTAMHSPCNNAHLVWILDELIAVQRNLDHWIYMSWVSSSLFWETRFQPPLLFLLLACSRHCRPSLPWRLYVARAANSQSIAWRMLDLLVGCLINLFGQITWLGAPWFDVYWLVIWDSM